MKIDSVKNKIVELLKRRHYDLFILLSLGVLFCVIYKTYGIFYAMNDDPTMHVLASGQSTGTPDGHLVFIRYALGAMIAGIYKIIPQYDWYGLFSMGFLYGCFFLLSHRLFSITAGKKGCWQVRCIGVVLILFFIFHSAMVFQFTIVAGVLGATGVFYLITADRKIKTSDSIIVLCLLLLSYLVRVKVCYMVLPIIMLITVWKLAQNITLEKGSSHSLKDFINNIPGQKNFNFAPFAKVLIVMLTGLLLFSTIIIIEKTAYGKSPWKEFTEYSHYRSLIMDYYGWPAYDGNEEFWDSIGISAEEHKCLNMYGILPDMSSEKIIAIGKYAQENNNLSLHDRLSTMKSCLVSAIKSDENNSTNIIFVIFFISAIFYAIKCKDRQITLLIVCAALIECSMMVYLLYMGRLPHRIISVYEYQCIMAVAGLLLTRKEYLLGHKSKTLFALAFMAAFSLFITLAYQQNNRVEINRIINNIYREGVAYTQNYSDMYIVISSGTFVSSKQFTVHEVNNSITNSVGVYGWSIYSPWNEQKLERFDLDISSNILLQPNVCMMTSKLIYADRLNNYFLSEGFIDSDYEIIDSFTMSDGSVVYTLRWHPAEQS